MKYFAPFLLPLVCALSTVAAQQPDNDREIVALVKQLQAQQVTMLANQAKIEAQLLKLSESARQARIYSSRSGGAK